MSGSDATSQNVYEELAHWLGKTPQGAQFLTDYLMKAAPEKGKRAELRGLLEELLEKSPENPFILHELGLAYYDNGQFDKAVEHLEKANFLFPGAPLPHLCMGAIFKKQGKLDEAIAQYKRCLGIGADSDSTLDLLAAAASAEGDDSILLLVCSCVTKCASGKNQQALHELGLLYLETQDYENAEKTYREMIRRAPEACQGYWGLGIVCHETARFTEAIEQYQKALSIEGDNTSLLYNLASTYEDAGKSEEAILTCQRILMQEPNHQEALENLAALRMERKN